MFVRLVEIAQKQADTRVHRGGLEELGERVAVKLKLQLFFWCLFPDLKRKSQPYRMTSDPSPSNAQQSCAGEAGIPFPGSSSMDRLEGSLSNPCLDQRSMQCIIGSPWEIVTSRKSHTFLILMTMTLGGCRRALGYRTTTPMATQTSWDLVLRLRATDHPLGDNPVGL